jgi:hypothetical protein
MFQSVNITQQHSPRMRYRCPSCSEIHQGFPALAYGLPDAIFALSAEEREDRAIISSDLCILDDARYFIRCVLVVPVNGYEEKFEYGPWVEVAAEDFGRYSVWFNLGASPGWNTIKGQLANALPGNEHTTLGLDCRMVLPEEDDLRPTVEVTDAGHALYNEQVHGMAIMRATELISNLKGFVLIVD